MALAGVGEGPDQALWSRIAACPGKEASVIGRPQKTASWLAALMNGTLGHALDYDDTAGFGRASVIIVPALLATGERLGCNGRRLLEGYISAYEVGFALNSLTRRGEDQHHGMHATRMKSGDHAERPSDRPGPLRHKPCDGQAPEHVFSHTVSVLPCYSRQNGD